LIYDVLVNCNWVVTRWQQYSTHLHTNNTQNVTKQTIHRTTQKNLGRVRAVPRVCELYPGICPTTEEKARKNLSQFVYITNISTFPMTGSPNLRHKV